MDVTSYGGLTLGEGSMPICGLRILMQMTPEGEQVFAYRFDGDIHTDVMTVVGIIDTVKHDLMHRRSPDDE